MRRTVAGRDPRGLGGDCPGVEAGSGTSLQPSRTCLCTSEDREPTYVPVLLTTSRESVPGRCDRRPSTPVERSPCHCHSLASGESPARWIVARVRGPGAALRSDYGSRSGANGVLDAVKQMANFTGGGQGLLAVLQVGAPCEFSRGRWTRLIRLFTVNSLVSVSMSSFDDRRVGSIGSTCRRVPTVHRSATIEVSRRVI